MTDESHNKNFNKPSEQYLEPISEKVKPDLEIINEKHDPATWEEITSHRSGYGSLIVSVKGILAKVIKPFASIIMRRQAIFNAHLIQVLNKMISHLTQQHVVFQEDIKSLYSDVGYFQLRVSELRQENVLMKQRLERVLSEIKEKKYLPEEVVSKITSEVESIWDHDYFLFENRFRGNQEDIQKRQEIYLPIFENEGTVLDIGCGRGEFLSLLQNKGIKAIGIDLNEDMVHICREKGLDVEKTSVFPYLKSLEDKSLGGIFASHIIEHLETSSLRDFIKLCYSKLKEGGSVAFETPNPLSIIVSSTSFYLDISHVKPLHPEAIKFLLASCGFVETKIKYLSPFSKEAQLQPLISEEEPSGLSKKNVRVLNQNSEKLNSILYGFQDYAIIGKKIVTANQES